jgi:3-phenylpropionate/cinnamic acid dioxygenase small subunit
MSFDRDAVENFLFLEARLLDGMAYESWLELFDEKALYWIPSNRDHTDPAREVSIVYADREQLAFRVDQLLSGSAWVQDPPPRLCRAVSNVEIREVE